MPSREIVYDENKFREMVVYVAEQMDGDPSFGATKLNKVLFFSDFFAYQELGDPISGADYQKLEHGPAPRRLLPVRRSLIEEGAVQLVKRPYLGREQKRLVALRDANVDVFAASELKVMDQVIEALEGASAAKVSRVSHRMSVGWQLAAINDSIPYQTVFLRPATRLSAERIDHVKGLAVEHEWVA